MRDLKRSMPPEHAEFLERALRVLRADERIVGVSIGGSFVTGRLDRWSDLDLVLAVDPSRVEEVMADRPRIAARLGNLAGAFTGEHVGEPRLLICLYADPVLHVDLKFVSLDDVGRRVEDPAVLWERDGRVTAVLRTREAVYPLPDLQWIEARFWIWVHYVGAKIGRGETFEVLDGLTFLRGRVLGPLALMEAGVQPAGVRKIETSAPSRARKLMKTLPRSYDAPGFLAALHAAVDLYRDLREALRPEGFREHTPAEEVALNYLADLEKHMPAASPHDTRT
ncbi:MAG TPA: nucleotidyltransferase domain-containing protein [bacterium]|nr:nucleotidyltransferase domain-containing protein [bacterium]